MKLASANSNLYDGTWVVEDESDVRNPNGLLNKAFGAEDTETDGK